MKSTASLYVELSGAGVGGLAATTTIRLARSLICDGFSDSSFAPVSPLMILVESASAALPSSLAAMPAGQDQAGPLVRRAVRGDLDVRGDELGDERLDQLALTGVEQLARPARPGW